MSTHVFLPKFYNKSLLLLNISMKSNFKGLCDSSHCISLAFGNTEKIQLNTGNIFMSCSELYIYVSWNNTL